MNLKDKLKGTAQYLGLDTIPIVPRFALVSLLTGITLLLSIGINNLYKNQKDFEHTKSNLERKFHTNIKQYGIYSNKYGKKDTLLDINDNIYLAKNDSLFYIKSGKLDSLKNSGVLPIYFNTNGDLKLLPVNSNGTVNMPVGF